MTAERELVAAGLIEDRQAVLSEFQQQQSWVTRWNELVFSGAMDGKGPQASFMASLGVKR